MGIKASIELVAATSVRASRDGKWDIVSALITSESHGTTYTERCTIIAAAGSLPAGKYNETISVTISARGPRKDKDGASVGVTQLSIFLVSRLKKKAA